jgi:hypothetical protein
MSDMSITREIALSMAGKTADALQPHSALDRTAIYEAIRSEIYEMLGAMADPASYVDAKVADQVGGRNKS